LGQTNCLNIFDGLKYRGSNQGVPQMQRLELLKNLTFGARVAEEETAELANYFVETDQWNRIFRGEIDIIRGDKGAGKSAIYSLLAAKSNELFDKKILLITAERPRGATVFKDLVAEPPTSELEFIVLWKLYISALIGQQIREFGIAAGEKTANKLIDVLEEQGLLESEFDLGRLFKQVRGYARAWFMPNSVEGSVTVDPTTGTPTFKAKITPGEPNADLRAKGCVSVDMLADLANRALTAGDYYIWVLMDRLDVAFVESHDLERNALRALFRVYRDFAAYERIKLKIFLRSDIWERIVEGGLREASHIVRVAILDWTPASLLNLIVRRLLSNDALINTFAIDKDNVLRDFDAQSSLFYRFFPPQVEQGTKKRSTLDWMISRCADATDKTAPRELIHLLNTVREKEVERTERGEGAPPGDQLFDRSVFKPALAIVSEARLIQTTYAEYPDLKPALVELQGEKTEQTIHSLAAIWKTSEEEAAKRTQSLVEIGFFQPRGGRDHWTYWVPFLYRDALAMSQGKDETE
jgi:hypothetical protein